MRSWGAIKEGEDGLTAEAAEWRITAEAGLGFSADEGEAGIFTEGKQDNEGAEWSKGECSATDGTSPPWRDGDLHITAEAGQGFWGEEGVAEAAQCGTAWNCVSVGEAGARLEGSVFSLACVSVWKRVFLVGASGAVEGFSGSRVSSGRISDSTADNSACADVRSWGGIKEGERVSTTDFADLHRFWGEEGEAEAVQCGTAWNCGAVVCGLAIAECGLLLEGDGDLDRFSGSGFFTEGNEGNEGSDEKEEGEVAPTAEAGQ